MVLEHWELAVAAGTLLASGFAAFHKLMGDHEMLKLRVASVERKFEGIEKREEEFRKDTRKTLDEIKDGIGDIRVAIASTRKELHEKGRVV